MSSPEKIPVLIVDDREENLTALEAVLDGMDIDVARALSGEEALRISLRTDFALVLLDVHMPDMDGYETAELMRANPKTRHLPIILMTAGMKDEQHLFKGYDAGAVDFITKPVEPAIVRGKVKVFCELYSKCKKLERHERHLEELVAERTVELLEEINQRSCAEELLRQTEERYRKLVETVTDYIYEVSIHAGQPVSTTHGPGCVAVTGYSSEEFAADPYLWYRMIFEEDRQIVTDQATQLLAGQQMPAIEHRIVHRDSSIRWVRNTPVLRFDHQGTLVAYDGLISDITERKHLEEQLSQSRKMESIGRLAGGVAHDFNNMLSVIIGCAEMAMLGLPEDDIRWQNLNQILKAAERSSDITRQLLAFSRKEIISPRPVNLNRMMEESQKTLMRLIGEDVSLAFRPGDSLWALKIDPSQMDQILVNLAVNSRDAMPVGGTLTIETDNVVIDEEFCRHCLDAVPGQYVRLSVFDNGVGMRKETLEHIFEPFFTTKGPGKGTGLGLATVYGIVAQNSGFIEVRSELGRGTTFDLYFPRNIEEPQFEPSVEKCDMTGSGTILLVEDDPMVRWMTAQMLNGIGYTVIQAEASEEAVSIFTREDQDLDLILTDVIMPGMNGREVADRAREVRPGIKVLYMSGYTADIVAERGMVEDGMHFIQKPFSVETLCEKVGAVMKDDG